MKKNKVLISLSGGMDSVTLLGFLLASDYEVEAVGFTYGSKHNHYENEAALKAAEFYGVPFELLDLSEAFAGISSALMKTGGDIPEGHYEAESMKQTVVPGRNMIFISILAGIAESRGCGKVAVGVHSGDHAIYPDCRPGFIHAMSTAVSRATDGKVDLIAPFLGDDKGSIIKKGLGFLPPVPYDLTRTCYKDQEKACGVCGSCTERLEAFEANGIPDPIEYEERSEDAGPIGGASNG